MKLNASNHNQGPTFLLLVSFAVTVCSCSLTSAQEEKKAEPPKAAVTADASEIRTESGRVVTKITDGLNNPTSVAIQPETGMIYVADSGNGQVVRVQDGKVEPMITDFPKETLGTTPAVNVGPLSIAFINKDNLIVASGGQPAGEDGLRQYALGPAAIKFDGSIKPPLTLIADPLQSSPAEGNFFGLAVASNAIYVSSQGDQTKGWVNMASRSAGDNISSLTRHISTVEAVKVSTPLAVSVTPHGYLVVSNAGELGPAKDSVAAFYEPVSKKMLLKLDLGLSDVCAIAYSPRRQMYVLDMAWGRPSEGGLYRIIEDKSAASGLKTKMIAKLPHPTAMCFDSDGGLIVTLRGEIDDKGNTKGLLVRIPSEENL